MEEVLKNIGWDSGFHLPVANEENQKLEQELAQLVLRKAKMSREFEDATEKYNLLQNHLKYVKQETIQNQALLSVYMQELDGENHRFKLAQAEKNKLKDEIRRMNKEIEDIGVRQQNKRADLSRHLAKLEKIKAAASWDTEAMNAWEESLKKRDEDNEFLKKFSQEDKRKLIENETKRQNLQVEVHSRRRMLEKMDVDTLNYEHALNRTAKVLKQMRDERAALVRQWQEAVKNLRQRDQDVKRMNRDIENMQMSIDERQEQLDEEKSYLSMEELNNHYIEMQIQEDNAHNSRLRRELFDIVNDVATINSELYTKEKEVNYSAHTLEKERLNIRLLREDIKKKKASIVTLNEKIELLKPELAETKVRTINASDKAKEFEQTIQLAQKFEIAMNTEVDYLNVMLFKRNTELQAAKEVMALKQNEYKAHQSTLLGIRKKMKKEEELLIYKKQNLSDLEMKVACLEAKLGNIEGDTLMEEDIRLWEAKIKDLDRTLAEHNEVKSLLQAQVLKLQEETIRLVTAISADNDSLQHQKDKLQCFVLMYEGGIKQAATARLKHQEKQVEENVLKLKVDKLNKAVNREDKEIYNLQRYRLELETMMKERHIEVQMHREVLLAKRKNLDEDRGRLKADIALRKLKIGQLQNKYALAIGLLGKDENGEPLSMGHFKIKSAQEKYMLQQEGDELDNKVRKAENEIIAMENTLKIVNETNANYKHSLEAVERQGKEEEELKELEIELKDKGSDLRQKKQRYLVKLNYFRELEETMEDLKSRKREAMEMLGVNQEEQEKYDREEFDRMEKIHRADKQIHGCKKNISKENLIKYDKDIYIRYLQDSNKSILYQLTNFSLENPGVAPSVNRYISDYQLTLPSMRTSFTTITSDSVRSCSSPGSSASSSSRSTAKAYANVLSSVEVTFDAESAAGPRRSNSVRPNKKK